MNQERRCSASEGHCSTARSGGKNNTIPFVGLVAHPYVPKSHSWPLLVPLTMGNLAADQPPCFSKLHTQHNGPPHCRDDADNLSLFVLVGGTLYQRR